MMLSTICCRTVLLSPAVVAVVVAILSSGTMMMPSIVSPVYGFNTNHAASSAASNTKRANYNRRNSVVATTVVLSLSPMDVIDATSIISTKFHAKKNAAGLIKRATATATATAAATATANSLNPDVPAQVLSDSSYALMEYPTFLPDVKISKLRIKYAQVMGRAMIISIGFLPNHSFHPEELAIQLFLLGGSVKPIIRSMQLFRCIASSNCNDVECELDSDKLGLGIGGEFECTYENNDE
jgi:hypothetical protein